MDAVASLLPETSTPEDRDRSDDIRGNPELSRALTMDMGRRSFTNHPDITRHRLSFMAPVTVLDIIVRDGVGEGDGETRRAVGPAWLAQRIVKPPLLSQPPDPNA
jgi:hypothetical protein